MKLKFHHPEPKEGDLVGPQYWRSLDERAEQPEFKEWLHREFPQGASAMEGVNRRNFLKIMSASFAAAGVGLAGCRRPEQHILPYSRQTGDTVPEKAIPGIPVFYATSFPDSIDSLPLIAETHQNRPTHVEGNVDYAPYGGGTNGFAHASVLDLYDPDRMSSAYEGNKRMTRAQVTDRLSAVRSKHAGNQGQGLAVLAAPSSSPTRRRLAEAFLRKFPRAIWAEYEPVSRNTAEKAASALFGAPVRPVYELSHASRLLSIDADFLHREPGATKMARDFGKTRRVKNKADAEHMSRLYAAEANFTTTGAMADHRLRLGVTEMPAFTVLLVAEILAQTGFAGGLAATLKSHGSDLGIDPKWVEECAKDLVAHRGEAAIIAGNHLPESVHSLVLIANEALGARGHTVNYLSVPAPVGRSFADLVAALKDGSVTSLVVLGGNPVYNAPADVDFGSLMAQVPETIRFGYHFDETSVEAKVNVAATHYLESWSDGRTYWGDYLPVQPMILPLFDCWQENEFVATLAGLDSSDPYGLVVETFRGLFGGNANFDRLLADGFQANSAFGAYTGALPVNSLAGRLAGYDLAAPGLSANNLEVALVKDDSVGDGTYANNGWMQECPDPMTKLAWDNAILVSPRLAEELGFDTKTGKFLIGGIAKKSQTMVRGREHAPVAEVTLNGVTVKGPLHVQPGLADWSIILPLGYGRRQVGRVGKGAGFDAYPLSHSNGFARTGAKITVTDEEMRLANTQEHWSMEGRAIIREANVETHLENSKWVSEMGMESHSPAVYGNAKDMPLAQKALETPRGGSLYDTPDFGAPPPNVDVWQSEEARAKFIPEQQWGMAIDLNTCFGCNACIIACQSENNIPIVGKEQVMRGREMHWIRMDRYYSSGDMDANKVSLPHDPQASLMPVACLHCEMAPCEQVCPVNATVHDSQGLNTMAYNRCVGTRYCANNCPYKVRRFNFFDYNKRAVDEFYLGPVGENQYRTEGGMLKAMQSNPDVTVRMRGVMEKCTYCVQRIQNAKIAQKVKAKDSNDIHVPDGLLRVACQAACPTEAISFGDISDPDSAVSKAKHNDRDYALLGYLNTRPRTTYLARLRNPNPAMPDYHATALSRKEYKKASGAEGAHGGGHGDSHGHETAPDAHGHGEEEHHDAAPSHG
jgi:molybdopterin-containing oxidoreductase family iron-sulfur binding subunit